MAHQQVYQAYPQNKGTLTPGQTISVNNYTVQVERYLSQGGFAHVYLVRTPQPVYNTTHHVLKRIAVANESMLTDVKKEVDIMRLLKGHPNIVHLIDAAWHKLPNNTFEVFILMEFCPGGGIIDMMNRRLRERLTEAEILQIFVDVCEGVAYMHNSRPPLLHRDLKVENILQSSPTSFKLCDFGSATTVSNPPTNMQEIRAVEADLNRHTTLQYRAPEMVDVYSKRPVNEKSDVWALGVLLYKLCYYTTPFEEHGPLAILNVQYRIPPYPVYSQDMNMLIASMLREHGSQRPSVFELLNHVHRLRGTRSKFSYNIPTAQPLVPHAHGVVKQQPPTSPNALEGLITYATLTTKPQMSIPPANQGIQARDRVLEAIAPMRRGRPNVKESQHASRPVSPHKTDQPRYTHPNGPPQSQQSQDNDFTVEQELAWKTATERSAIQGKSTGVADAAWNIDKSLDTKRVPKERSTGFGNDFAENLWSTPNPNLQAPLQPRLTPSPNRVVMSVQRTAEPTSTSLAFTGASRVRPKQDRLFLAKDARNKDAFEGLGLMVNVPKSAPTLGEARKLRTGLAMISPPATSSNYGDYIRDSDSKSRGSQQPTPSPQLPPRYLSAAPLAPQPISPVPTTGSSNSPIILSPNPLIRTAPQSISSPEGGAVESRFPSLEELDAQFTPSTNALYPSAVNEASTRYNSQAKQTNYRSQFPLRNNNIGSSETGGDSLRPSLISNLSHSADGTRSEQVTGIAMRDVRDNKRFPDSSTSNVEPPAAEREISNPESRRLVGRDKILQPKPLVVRKRSSNSLKTAHPPNVYRDFEKSDTVPPTIERHQTPKLPELPQSSTPFRDWLTGDDTTGDNMEEIKTQATPDMPIIRDSPSKRASFIEHNDFRIVSSSAAQHVVAPEPDSGNLPSAEISPTVSKFKRNFPDVEQFVPERLQQSPSAKVTKSWGPVRKEAEPDSSSADEGPEEPDVTNGPPKRHGNRVRGRQSSVHDLVYQYGGGLTRKDSDKDKLKGKGKAKEVTRERERPSPQYNIAPSDFTPTKSRPLPPVSEPVKVQEGSQKVPSPTGTSFKPPSTSQSKPGFAGSERPAPPPLASKPVVTPKTNNPDVKSAAAARNRPQSMFIFPSKSTDTQSTPPVNNLLPPPDPRPRATRRTSISDIVQLYEAIASPVSSSVALPPTPTTVHRPFPSMGAKPSAENIRPQKSFPAATKTLSSNNSTSDDKYSGPTDSFARVQTPRKDTTRQVDNSSGSPVKVHRRLPSDRETPADDSTPRARKTSTRDGHSVTHSHSRAEAPTARLKAPSTSQSISIPRGSPRKLPVPLSEEVSNTHGEEPSSSPERPYQGVGKLIDQWQKKSAEADQSRPAVSAKRGDLYNKRLGIVHVDDR